MQLQAGVAAQQLPAAGPGGSAQVAQLTVVPQAGPASTGATAHGLVMPSLAGNAVRQQQQQQQQVVEPVGSLALTPRAAAAAAAASSGLASAGPPLALLPHIRTPVARMHGGAASAPGTRTATTPATGRHGAAGTTFSAPGAPAGSG
jgi:hypothetical protein